jgi:hypothetical protein
MLQREAARGACAGVTGIGRCEPERMCLKGQVFYCLPDAVYHSMQGV